MRILFLDDDRNRHDFFREEVVDSWDEVDYVWDAKECIAHLENGGPSSVDENGLPKEFKPYDLVCLDHDLGARHYVKEIESTGSEVARFIGTNLDKKKYPKKI